MVTVKFPRKILVPVDGSHPSLVAQETAALIAEKTGAQVTVFHALKELRLQSEIPDNVYREIVATTERKGESVTADALALFTQEKVKANVETIRSSDPAEAVLDYSKKDYDLIVIGAHGESEKEPYALGSVTKKVMMHAKCATLIAKKTSPLANLLICIDGSENSLKALERGQDLAESLSSQITVLNVQERKLYESSRQTAEKAGEEILSHALDIMAKRKMTAAKKLEIGTVSEKIVQVAEKGNYDLIVMGSKGHGTVRRFLLGSETDDVAHKAKCSVLTVPG